MKPIQLNSPVFCSTVRPTVDRLTLEIYRDLLRELTKTDASIFMSDAKKPWFEYRGHIVHEVQTLNTILS